jgi:inner membrane protein
MASIGHIAVGMAAARAATQPASPKIALVLSMLWWSALSLLPDADVIGFRLGVRYHDEWGHRGATHSFVFALGAALVLGALAPLVRARPVRTALLALVVIGSHALLDTLTDGGHGCALLWPFSDARFFAPWNPIPVSPIGGRFFTDVGLRVMLAELWLFAPLYVYALWPRSR